MHGCLLLAPLTYDRVIVGKRIVDLHVLEEPLDVSIKELLHFRKIEARIDEHRPNVRLDHVGHALRALATL